MDSLSSDQDSAQNAVILMQASQLPQKRSSGQGVEQSHSPGQGSGMMLVAIEIWWIGEWVERETRERI